ncbi:hypothetical protein MBLNU459_g7729t1 [Dothideomycetes sp. NU459]
MAVPTASATISAEADEKNVVSSATAPSADPEARPECFTSLFVEVTFVLTTTMVMAMGPLLAGSTEVITSFIGKDLNMTTSEITWIGSASSLAGGAFLLFFGRIADLFGRKALTVGSLFLFAILALGAGFCRTPIALDTINGVMGLVTAAAVPAAQGILGVTYNKPSKRKNYAFACYSAGNPIGFVLGTIFSGIATDIFSWRASFWLLAIIYLIFGCFAIWTIPKESTAKQPFTWQTLKEFDVLGTILTIAGIGTFCAALSSGDTASHSWKTGYILALLLAGVILIITFILWENYASQPLLPMSIWKNRNFSLVILVLSLGFLAFPVVEFFMALFFQEIWHYSALNTAVHLLPMVIMGILVNFFTAIILHRVSSKLLMVASALAYTVSFLLAALNRQTSSYWCFCFTSLVLAVIGADVQFNVANIYVMSSLPQEQQSIASSIFQTVSKLCQSVGYGVGTAVFNGVQAKPRMGGYYRAFPATQPYAAVFWFATACAGLSVVLACFLTIGIQGNETGEVVDEVDGSRDGRGADPATSPTLDSPQNLQPTVQSPAVGTVE